MSNYLKGILIFIFLILFTASFASAQEIFVVDDDGNPLTTYPTLAAAVATAKTFPGGPHYIEVMEGNYTDAGLVIDNSIISIVGVGDPANTIFTAPSAAAYPTSPSNTFMDVSATTDLILSGFTVIGYDVGIGTYGAMATGLQVSDIVFDGCIVGIATASNDGTFDNLEIMNGWLGYLLFSMVGGEAIDNNTLSNSKIHDISRAPAVFIGISNPHVGAAAASINGNSVVDCEIYDNSDQGILFAGDGFTTGSLVDNCNLYNNQWNAVWMISTSGGTITDNVVYGNVKGSVNPDSTLLTHTSLGALEVTGNTGHFVIQNNNVYDNGGLGTSGDGTAYADYGLHMSGAGTANIGDNCFWGHAGVQAADYTGGGSWWHDNYYGDLAYGAINYPLDGGVEIDYAPKMRMNNPTTVSPTIEVWDNFVVDFEFSLPSVCDVTDFVELALYEFTVTWDPTKLEFVSGDNAGFLGAPGTALYIITGDPSSGNITFSGTNFDGPNAAAGILATIEFHAIGTGSASVTTSSTYRDVNNANIPVGSTPLVLTLVDTEDPTITVTANNPIGDDTYSDGTGNVKLYIEGNVTDNYALSTVWYRFNDAGSWTLIKTVSGTADTYGDISSDDYYLNITGLSEGAHNVNVIVVDASGNRDSVYYNFNIDRTGPDVAGLALVDSDGCAAAGYTSSDVVDVSWSNPDASAVQHEFYYNMDAGWGKYGPSTYENPTTFTLDGTEGTHQLWVRQYDVYGNVGPQMGPVAIILDKTAPAPSALVLAGGAAKTNTVNINADANQDVPGGATHIAWSDDAGELTCDGASWIAAPIHPFAVTLESGDGVKTIYMVSKDAAGNVSAPISDDIELDQTAPEFADFVVTATDGSECDANYTVAVTFSWTDGDVNFIKLFSINPSDNTDTSGIVSIDISAATSPMTVAYAIPSGYRTANGLNVVYGFLVDDIGNAGGSANDDVFVDLTNPTITSIQATDFDYDGIDPTIAVNWSDNAEVQLEIIGLAADVTELLISETGVFGGEEVSYPITPANPFYMNYTFATTTGCSFDYVYVKAVDCAGRMSAVVSDGIKFDFDDPTITDFSVTSADPTNVLSANLNIDAVDNCLEWKWKVYEDGYEGMGSGWTIFGGPPDTYTLALQPIGDGTRTLHLMVADPAGNVVWTSTTVEVDQTAPTGTFVVQQFGNPLAMAGYTNSLTNNEVVSIVADADAVDMAVRNGDGSSNTGWIPLASSYSPWTLVAGGSGVRTVEMIFRDAAGNYGSWIPVTITYLDGTGLIPPPSAVGVPGGSITLDWAPVAVAQSYYIKYNFTGQLPTYDDGIPPNPGAGTGDTLEGIFAANVADTHYVFEGPHPDIYAVSIWTIDMAGNLSATCNIDVVETNYTLGDMDYDGEVEFVDDFGNFAATYSLSFGESGFNEDADFGPTSDASGTGYPIPDGTINVEDLAIMGMNYNAASSSSKGIIIVDPKPAAQPMKLDAELTYQGTDVVISIRSDNAESMMLYNFVFDLKTDAEILKVEAGEAFDNTETSWFFHNDRSSMIDITGIVLGEDIFDGELARITIRTEATDIELNDVELIARDRINRDVDIEFNVVNKLEVLPTDFALAQNYPNPFNPATTIDLSLPVACDYSLTIYNVTGQVVEAFEGHAEAGVKSIVWEAARYSSGIYFYRVVAGDFNDTKKMVLLK